MLYSALGCQLHLEVLAPDIGLELGNVVPLLLPSSCTSCFDCLTVFRHSTVRRLRQGERDSLPDLGVEDPGHFEGHRSCQSRSQSLVV